jgi:hypothetical protein
MQLVSDNGLRGRKSSAKMPVIKTLTTGIDLLKTNY